MATPSTTEKRTTIDRAGEIERCGPGLNPVAGSTGWNNGTPITMRILFAEDDAETAGYVAKGLSGEGYIVDHLADGKDALSQAMSGEYDLLILDRMLPGLDGLSILKSLRAAKVATPAILLTAMGGLDDRVAGLRGGADDYMVKPFAFVELLARIETVRRRPALRDEVLELVVGDLRLDLMKREVHQPQRDRVGARLEPGGGDRQAAFGTARIGRQRARAAGLPEVSGFRSGRVDPREHVSRRAAGIVARSAARMACATSVLSSAGYANGANPADQPPVVGPVPRARRPMSPMPP